MSPLRVSRLELLEIAKKAFAPTEKPHWSTTSAILGRIQDEALYGDDLFGAYATLEAYAKDSLDLTKGEIATAVKLWRLIKRCEPVIAYERWAAVKRARALLLIEVLEAGGDVQEWFTRMQAAVTTSEFEQEVRRFLKEEVWAVFKVRVPLDLLGVIEEALVRAIEANAEIVTVDEGAGAILASEAALDPRYRFQCLEAICVEYLQRVPAPQMDLRG